MSDEIVIMSKNNANLCPAIPLYRRMKVSSGQGYEMVLLVGEEEPVAYAIEYDGNWELYHADTVKYNCEFLGEL